MFKDLSLDQIRQQVDADQIFQAWLEARAQLASRFEGSMSWKTVRGRRYLYRKVKGNWRSLGPEGPETEEAFQSFTNGRLRVEDLIAGLSERLDTLAPVIRAMRLGRFPRTPARILRRMEDVGLLGRNIVVVGTNALYAYERAAALQVESGLLATGDMDLLYDARSTLKLAVTDLREDGILGLLRRADQSFTRVGNRGYRAVNRDGFMVDLIKPARANPMLDSGPDRIGGVDDLVAAEINGLAWLANTPKFEQVVFDELGYPLRLVVPDPRAFALHKFWLSVRDDRVAEKRRRDRAQAEAVTTMVRERLPHLRFDDDCLKAIPKALWRALPEAPTRPSRLEPDW